MKAKILALFKSCGFDYEAAADKLVILLGKGKKKSFFESEIYDKNAFKAAFPDWNNTKLKYYYDNADSWSIEGHKYVDWKRTVSNWANRDALKGHLKFGDEKVEKKVMKW